jgi:hypothetical protein
MVYLLSRSHKPGTSSHNGNNAPRRFLRLGNTQTAAIRAVEEKNSALKRGFSVVISSNKTGVSAQFNIRVFYVSNIDLNDPVQYSAIFHVVLVSSWLVVRSS